MSTRDNEIEDVVVIGAGISGLSLCYYLKELNIKFKLLEKSETYGGVIQTKKLDSSIIERGPQSCLLEPELRQLIKVLGIENELIFPEPNCDDRFIANPSSNKKLAPTPKNPISALLSGFITLKDLLNILKDIFAKHNQQKIEDISIHDLFSKKLGDAFTENIVSAPFVGIWANNIKNLSARSVLPKAFDAYIKGNSVFKSLIKQAKQKKQINSHKIASFKYGLSTLTTAIYEKIKDDLLLNTEIQDVQYKDNIWHIKLNNKTLSSKHLVITTGLNSLKNLISNINECSNLEKSLISANSSPIGILQLELEKFDYKGFGFLIPPKHSSGLLGSIFTTSLFPSKSLNGKSFITCFCGGAINKEYSNIKDSKITNDLINQVKLVLGITSDIKILAKDYWEEAIPTYGINHYKLIEERELLSNKIPSLHLHTNLWDGVSIPSRVRRSMFLAAKLKIKTKST